MASDAFTMIVSYLRDNVKLDEPGLTAQELRARMDAMTGSMSAPDGITFEPATVAGVPALWSCPDGAISDAVLLYFHGGGYVIGSPDTHRNITARLAQRLGCAVLSVHYGLAPEQPHPAAINDATAAYRSLLSDGFSPRRIAFAGDSAGGGLTLAALMKLRDDGVALPAAAVAISPWTDLTLTSETMQSMADQDPMCNAGGLGRMAAWFVGDGDHKDPYVSPIFGDATGLPPLLIQVGEIETLRDDAVGFGAVAVAGGVDCTVEVVPEMVHVFQAFAGMVPEADAALDRIAAFLRPHMGL